MAAAEELREKIATAQRKLEAIKGRKDGEAIAIRVTARREIAEAREQLRNQGDRS
ncbi:hypothetical protein [Protofrankia symbiont of Coriaria ruscifolia]|uniref:hypothetical protein n=1 Tax=Protofrankia symbiont of Coriaria ruscifolia TaxID=1306542 RepID=UPI0013EFA590|nr:hypothetical protein [Protofrankia symbiont of Coriaria ruscifolia]